MRFALIGDHRDGLAMTSALTAQVRHQLAAYAGPVGGAERLRQCGAVFRQYQEVEELLAQSDVELVIVADDLEHRPAVLKRALQADKHVLCVHPADLRPDICYEASMIVQDTRRILVPLLPERLAPAMLRLQQLCREGSLGIVQVVEGERKESAANWDGSSLLSVWDGLRQLQGEIREVSVLTAAGEGLQPGEQTTLTGRFARGALFHLLMTPSGESQSCRWLVRGEGGTAELIMAQGPYGLAQLHCQTPSGEIVESFAAWDPWQRLAEVVEDCMLRKPQPMTWLDETRCLELFDAARTSARRRRVVPMDYEASSEEANFKSTMTAVGCGLLLVLLVLFFAMPLIPGLKYVFLPLLVLFLAMQLLRWLVPSDAKEKEEP
jgi:predicted dehydrogenase